MFCNVLQVLWGNRLEDVVDVVDVVVFHTVPAARAPIWLCSRLLVIENGGTEAPRRRRRRWGEVEEVEEEEEEVRERIHLLPPS